jgi:hypothetical protein
MAKVGEGRAAIMTTPPIHPATPSRLKTAYRRAKHNIRATAEAIGVNQYYVHRLIRYGLEPSNPNIRRALFLPKHPRSNHTQQRQPLPEHIKWWRYTLDKQARTAIVERLYKHAQDINNNPSG